MGNIKNISEILPDEPIPESFEDEIHFNNTVREYIVFGVLLLVLSIVSHMVVLRYRRRELQSPLQHHHHHHHHHHHNDEEEAAVDRVALWLCTFSLSVSLGAVLLLPISILGNEVLTLYQDSAYVRWINLSLIQGMWNMVFLFSNLSLFVGLPFAYLFTESEGFPGSRKGLRARIVETVVVLSLLVVLVFGVACVLAFLLGYYQEDSVLEIIDKWGSFYLPFLYSLISCLGVLVLLLCTPVGLAHMFTALGSLVIKPVVGSFLRDTSSDLYHAALMDEAALSRQLDQECRPHASLLLCSRRNNNNNNHLLHLYRTAHTRRLRLEEGRRVGVLRRTLAYPLALLVLLALTGSAVVIVGLNTLQLLVGIKALPLSTTSTILGVAQQGKRTVLLSVLGGFGAVLEVILILYLIAASVLGCYTLPVLSGIRPRPRDTPMVHVIANCVVVLILSSALPLLARTLGISNFDLLGDYGRISWLGNFWIVLGYNVLFAGAAAWCLFEKFTATLRHEIYIRFKVLVMSFLTRDSSFNIPVQVISAAGIINSGPLKDD